MKTIVVGVDGSAHAEAALEFALEEAALRGASLRVVSAWELPSSVAVGGVYTPEVFDVFPQEAQTILSKALARATELQPAVPVEGKVIEGSAAAALLEEARDAAMLVVGSRGRGGFASLLLGSVTQQVVHHAPCPIVVVR